jgi:hypothetical protein
MPFCLIPDLASIFQQKLKSGEINPERLSEMTSLERRDFFSSFLGAENAQQVNALFESKLLLKNQKEGMVTWAKQVAGMKPEAQRDLLSKINKLDRVLNPLEERAFFEDLAAQKLGASVTIAEAKQISELAQRADELKQKDLTVHENRIEYGNAILDLQQYATDISPINNNVLVNAVNLPKTLMSSMDFSAPFRQGWGMLTRGEFWQSFPKMFKFAFNEQAYKDMMADVITRPSFDKMKSAGLRITKLSDKLTEREEAFQSSLADKIPGIRASERAFSGFLTKVRADVFDTLLKQAELAGENTAKGSQTNREIANVVNDFTGSGSLGKGDKYGNTAPALNMLLFSPRKISATVNMLNPKRYLDPKVSPTARRAAIRNMVGSAGATATLLALAAAMGIDVEKDPRSSDFGKVKVGDTRYDLTGGNGTYAVLIARLLSNQTKSTTSELVSTLGESFGSSNRFDTLTKFARNKLAPSASFVADWLAGENAVGEPFEAGKGVVQRLMPMIVSNALETYENEPNALFRNAMAEMFGIGTQTYSNDADWVADTGKELTQFREQFGEDVTERAGAEYNEKVSQRIEAARNDSEYDGLTEEEKASVLSSIKSDAKAEVFKSYRFRYKQERAKKNPTVQRLSN